MPATGLRRRQSYKLTPEHRSPTRTPVLGRASDATIDSGKGSSIKHLSILAVLSLIALAVACNSGDEAEQRYNQGLELERAGRLQEAVALYARAIELEPAAVSPYVSRSKALFLLGRFDDSVEDATKAIELEPNDLNLLADAYVARGAAYGSLGRFDDSVDDSTKAIELEPSDVNILASAYFNRATGRLNLGRFNEAVDDATKAIELEPRGLNLRARVYLSRATAYRLLGRFNEALDDATKAIELDELADAYFARAILLSQLGREVVAQADLATACELGQMEACDLRP